jgi:signal transduction histidine kinase
MRRHFVRRVVLGVALFFALLLAVNFLAFALFSGLFGRGDHGGPGPLVAVLAVGLVLAFFLAGRTVRRMAGRVGDVMEAADRVAAGDYTVRLQERGPGDMRRLARSFNAMTARLRASEEQRQNLLADLAHELRTPLSVIQGNLEGMLDGLYASDRSHIEPVLEETKVMARLLDDLQTLSTAEAGALRLHREIVEPEQLVVEAVAAFGPRAGAEGVRLDRRVAPELPSVDVDPVRIAEVFANLLLNALQHTPPGGSVVVAAGPSGDGRVAFEVTDTGPGIPPETLPHVFNRFVKAADSGGAGLGLAIAKSLVEAHGGEIVADSPPGGGTTMRFVLPAAR